MPEYILDTDRGDSLPEFTSLQPFVQGYIEAAFFTSHNEVYDRETIKSEEAQEDIHEGRVGGELPSDAGYSDMTEETLAEVIADCEVFQAYAADLLAIAYERGYDEIQAGRDFWFTRNGHGCGFWDRDQLEAEGLGDRLSKRARKQGNIDMWWDMDNERAYFS